MFVSTFFSWVTKSFESDIHELAETKYDSIANEAIEFTINDDTLIIGSDKEKQKLFLTSNNNFFAEKADQPTYLIIDLDYQRCKDQELGLGLDLQGNECYIRSFYRRFGKKTFAGNSSKFLLKPF